MNRKRIFAEACVNGFPEIVALISPKISPSDVYNYSGGKIYGFKPRRIHHDNEIETEYILSWLIIYKVESTAVHAFLGPYDILHLNTICIDTDFFKLRNILKSHNYNLQKSTLSILETFPFSHVLDFEG